MTYPHITKPAEVELLRRQLDDTLASLNRLSEVQQETLHDLRASEIRCERMRELLEVLNRRGGLGLSVHAEIAKVLAMQPKDGVSS